LFLSHNRVAVSKESRPPFEGTTSAAIFDSILHKTPDALERWNPALPAALDEIIRKAQAKNCEQRYQNAGELREDLTRLKQQLSSGPTPTVAVAQALRRPAISVVSARNPRGGAGDRRVCRNSEKEFFNSLFSPSTRFTKLRPRICRSKVSRVAESHPSFVPSMLVSYGIIVRQNGPIQIARDCAPEFTGKSVVSVVDCGVTALPLPCTGLHSWLR
jgi:hypothetical protein